MGVDEVFSEKNLGIPVKVRMGNDKDGESVYGKYLKKIFTGDIVF